jgi:outer membrane protein OmpA-like peptidoglycan-associated protein
MKPVPSSILCYSVCSILVFCFCASTIHSQSETYYLNQAHKHFKKNQFYEANLNYSLAGTKLLHNNKALFQAGISAYEANQTAFAIECFEKLKAQNAGNTQTINWYLAKAYQHQNDFAEAINAYKLCYKELSKKDPQRAFIANELLRCSQGLKIKRRSSLAIVEPVGSEVNSRYDEMNPLPVPGNTKSIYIAAVRETNQGGKRNDLGLPDPSNGRYRSDIYQMNLHNGNWHLVPISNHFINSSADDLPVSFSETGEKLIYSSSWHRNSVQLYMDSISASGVSLHKIPFKSAAIEDIGDNMLTLYQDSILIFSSARLGGYGGYDLYFSVFRNNLWSRAVNLGPQINSPFNEIHPFLANDGLSLYYSSDNLNSIGGYDIFKTAYRPEARQWIPSKNLGIPINSAGDELGFRLTTDGLAGIFYSNRKTENLGGYDLYWSYFKEELSEQTTIAYGTPIGQIYDTYFTPEFLDGTQTIELKSENFKPRDFKVYAIDPIYYSESDFIETSKTKNILDQVLKILVVHPEVKIQIFGHSYEETPDPVNMYYSMKKAEEIENYLIKHHVSKSRISCYGLGASLPLVKLKMNGSKPAMADKLNKRIELYMITSDTGNVRITYNSPLLTESIKSERSGSIGVMRNELSYSFYLGESAGLLALPGINFQNGIVYIRKQSGDDKYRYYFGVYKQFKDAEASWRKLKSIHPTIGEIKAFLDGNEIDRSDIINHVLKHADLLLYLNYLNEADKNKK